MRAHNAQRRDDATIQDRGNMGGDLILVVDFELLRDMLLNDEYLTSQSVTPPPSAGR